MNKICTRCKQLKPINLFPCVSRENRKPRAQCKQCCAEKQRQTYASKPQQYRNYVKKRRIKYNNVHKRIANLKTFGLTIEDYETMLKSQNKQCAICGTLQCTSGKRLAIDHCHLTGRIRGLLCLRCNQAIGKFNDNYFLLQQAADYVSGQVSVGHPERRKPDCGNGKGIESQER
jgi:hypothetical protein